MPSSLSLLFPLPFDLRELKCKRTQTVYDVPFLDCPRLRFYLAVRY